MTSYLLLRNNKESGPHSLEQLLGFGLKPYDLIWVNGKSAAWRYPSEIDELHQYVPEPVEQPFDRFFKKPEPTNIEDLIPKATSNQVQRSQQVELVSPAVEKPIISSIPVPEISNLQPATLVEPIPVTHVSAQKDFTEYEQQYIPKKSVYVTLPGQRSTQAKPAAAVTASSQPVPAPVVPQGEPAPTINITENPETAKIKYSQPLDEIKEMYVKTLQQRKDKIARQTFFKVNLKRVAVIAALIGFGVLTGYIIKSGNGKFNNPSNTLAQSTQQPATSLVNNTSVVEEQQQPGSTESADNSIQQQSSPETNAPLVNSNTTKVLPLEAGQSPAPSMQQPAVRGPQTEKVSLSVSGNSGNAAIAKQAKQQPYTPSERNDATGERTRSVRSVTPVDDNDPKSSEADEQPVEIKSTRKSPKSVLGNQVFVTTNDYKRVAFGGIRNLELTVTNNSKYDLDNVMVELQYLKPSEEAFRTENIRFRNIAPNEAATIRIPDTNRGIKVKYRIVSIGSRQLNDDLANN